MYRKISILLAILLTALLSVIFISTAQIMNADTADPKYNSSAESDYILKIDNDTVVLFNGMSVIKQYDINISVLPGEDIELLYNGIKVDSIAEADSYAEDFDG